MLGNLLANRARSPKSFVQSMINRRRSGLRRVLFVKNGEHRCKVCFMAASRQHEFSRGFQPTENVLNLSRRVATIEQITGPIQLPLTRQGYF